MPMPIARLLHTMTLNRIQYIKTVENTINAVENIINIVENTINTVENTINTVENTINIVENTINTVENKGNYTICDLILSPANVFCLQLSFHLALSKVADGLLPMAPNPTPTANPSTDNTYMCTYAVDLCK